MVCHAYFVYPDQNHSRCLLADHVHLAGRLLELVRFQERLLEVVLFHAGVTAKGKLGEKPTISFKAPMTVSDGSYVVLQKGDGDTIEEGDRVCAQGIALNVKDGTELMDTWTKNTPDCSLLVDSSTLSSTYYDQIKGAKLNTTIGFGVNAEDSSGYSYILAMTFVSKSKDLKKSRTCRPICRR